MSFLRIFTSILFAICAVIAHAQSLDSVFAMVERNNVSLRTYRVRCEAAKQESRVDIALADPEVEFAYLWGTPEGVGDRRDVSVVQPLDFATLFGTRRREARSRQQLADIELEQARSLVCLAVEEQVVNLTWLNQAMAELATRLATARAVEQACAKMLEAGEIGKVEMNEAHLAVVEAEAEMEKAGVERRAALVRLQAMGVEGDYTSQAYPLSYLKGDKSLMLSRQQAEVAAQGVSAAKAEGMPGVNVGYMAELTREEKFRGVKVGVSIPLWRNRNNVRHAKAGQMLAQAEVLELEHNLAAQRSELREKAAGIGALCEKLQASLSRLDTTPLLGKAMEAGDVSVVDFISNRQRFYDLQDQLLELRRDHQLALAQLAFIE